MRITWNPKKYPTGVFKGKIVEPIDYSKNGTFSVTAKGVLTIHGVTQNREIKGDIQIDNSKITLSSNFDVKLTDYKIDVPKLVFTKIAETILIKSKYVLLPYTRKL